jgi:hypothetical protein
VKVVSHKEYSVFFLVCPLFAISACSGHAEHAAVRAGLAASAEALEANDASGFFATLDERARFAMGAIVSARQSARSLIEADYPIAEKNEAFAALGDAAQVSNPATLFARRCGASCLATFADLVGAPATEVAEGDEVKVTTVRGRTLHMHAGSDGRYGIVWNTRALFEERSRASRELVQIRDNAEIYRRRSALTAQQAPHE